MNKSGLTEGQSASELIDKRIAALGDWRGERPVVSPITGVHAMCQRFCC